MIKSDSNVEVPSEEKFQNLEKEAKELESETKTEILPKKIGGVNMFGGFNPLAGGVQLKKVEKKN
jgi:hypothetical protein